MSETLQEINAVVDRHDFLDKKMAEYAVAPWIEQFHILDVYMSCFDTNFDNEVENEILHVLEHPYVKTLLKNADLTLAKAEYEEKEKEEEIKQPQENATN